MEAANGFMSVKIVKEEEVETPKIPPENIPKPGYDHDFLDPVRCEDYCGICLLVLRDPVQVTNCGHAFCMTCLESWFKTCEKNLDATLTCPLDNDTITRDEVMQDKKSHRAVQSLTVHCDYRISGCMFTAELRYLQEHMLDCKFRMVFCPLMCGLQVMVCSLDTHLQNECLKRRGCCSICKEEMEVGAMEEHTHVCPLMEVTCDYCKEVTVLRQQLSDHHQVCYEFPILCSYKQFGCEIEMRRKNMAEHKTVYIQQHMDLMMNSFTSLKSEMSASIEKLNDDLRKSKDELEETKGELLAKCAENRKLTEEVGKKHEECQTNKTELEQRIMELSEDVNTCQPIIPYTWRFQMRKWNIFDQMIEESPRFYSKKKMYKLYLKVGSSGGDVYWFDCRLTQGEYDKDLQWPMEGNFTLSVREVSTGQLLSSTNEINPDDRQRPESHTYRLLFTYFNSNKNPLMVDVCVQ